MICSLAQNGGSIDTANGGDGNDAFNANGGMIATADGALVMICHCPKRWFIDTANGGDGNDAFNANGGMNRYC